MDRGSSRRDRHLVLRAILLLLVCSLLPRVLAYGDTFRTHDPGTGSVEISGPWQFHTSDDMAWAKPSYDDSGWEQISADKPWGAQTHPSYTGFAWYRRHITIENSGAAATKNLAILIPPVDDVYDLYWNGKKIGSYGAIRITGSSRYYG